MKNLPSILIFGLLLGNSVCLHAQRIHTDTLQAYIDRIVDWSADLSIHKHEHDWQDIRNNMHNMCASANDLSDLVPAVEYLYAQIGDYHGGLIYNNQRFNKTRKQSEDKAGNHFDPELWTRIQSGEFIPEGRIIRDSIAYISIPVIPAFNPDMIQEKAAQIRAIYCALLRQSPKGWIVDLRLNGGGNMYPMFSGIGPLLGDGVVGGALDVDQQITANWYIKEGNFFYDEYQTTDLPAECKPQHICPKVAVLIGPYTSSSGEALAVAFAERPNTLILGEPTAGYTTVNGWHSLQENLVFMLAESYYADRKLNVYQDKVQPEIFIPFNDFTPTASEDPQIEAAVEWLGRG
ncbi:MAG: hypothetical protein GYB31_09000 [Bacteroidetes bacterium]|nr:hypothetical protein [Bacteroidota bacterium]